MGNFEMRCAGERGYSADERGGGDLGWIFKRIFKKTAYLSAKIDESGRHDILDSSSRIAAGHTHWQDRLSTQQ